MTEKQPVYMTTPEAAAYLSLSKQWLEISRHKGDGPPYIKLGRAVRYSRADLDDWMAGRRRVSTSEAT